MKSIPNKDNTFLATAKFKILEETPIYDRLVDYFAMLNREYSEEDKTRPVHKSVRWIDRTFAMLYEDINSILEGNFLQIPNFRKKLTIIKRVRKLLIKCSEELLKELEDKLENIKDYFPEGTENELGIDTDNSLDMYSLDDTDNYFEDGEY